MLAKIPKDVFVLGVLVAASLASFGLGYLAGRDAAGQGSDINLEPAPLVVAKDSAASGGQVVASKSGTKYYLPSCSGASRIAEANKVWFASVAAARSAGYAPAANCPGL